MIADKKLRSLAFIAGFLLITNIIMLIFFMGINDSKKTVRLRDSAVGTFLKKDVGFTDQQMDGYQHLKKADMDSMKPLFTSLRNSKDSFYRYVTITAPDSEIENQSKVIGMRQMQVDQQMLVHFKRVRALCTADQQVKFDSLFKNVISKITNGRNKKINKDQ